MRTSFTDNDSVNFVSHPKIGSAAPKLNAMNLFAFRVSAI
jgi:hypothetical protein